MSRRLLVACEGETDYIVIQAAADSIVGEYVPVRLQPEETAVDGGFGARGGGWKGVQKWCGEVREQGGIDALYPHDSIVVVHLDADVADDAEIDCAKPCPPPEATVDAVVAVASKWLGFDELPTRLVWCVPSKNTEAWILASQFPANAHVATIECRAEPQSLLVGLSPKFVAKKGRKYRKITPVYAAARSAIASTWLQLEGRCTEAKRFGDALRVAFVLLVL